MTQTYNTIASYTQCKDYKQTLAHANDKIVLLKFIHQLFEVSGQRFQSIPLKILYQLLCIPLAVLEQLVQGTFCHKV